MTTIIMGPQFIAELVLGIVEETQDVKMETINYGVFTYFDEEAKPLFTLTVTQQGKEDSLLFVGINIKAESLHKIASAYAEKYNPKSISIDLHHSIN